VGDDGDRGGEQSHTHQQPETSPPRHAARLPAADGRVARINTLGSVEAHSTAVGWRQQDDEHTRTPSTTTKETTVTTSLKLKLIGLSTTIALFALPVSDALANRYT